MSQQHYPGIPDEISPNQAERLLRQRPGSARVIQERVHLWRMAHDPTYGQAEAVEAEPEAEQVEQTEPGEEAAALPVEESQPEEPEQETEQTNQQGGNK